MRDVGGIESDHLTKQICLIDNRGVIGYDEIRVDKTRRHISASIFARRKRMRGPDNLILARLEYPICRIAQISKGVDRFVVLADRRGEQDRALRAGTTALPRLCGSSHTTQIAQLTVFRPTKRQNAFDRTRKCLGKRLTSSFSRANYPRVIPMDSE